MSQEMLRLIFMEKKKIKKTIYFRMLSFQTCLVLYRFKKITLHKFSWFAWSLTAH